MGRVWLNPPYGRQAAAWMEKMAKHGNGIALTFARTDTSMFHDHVYPYAWGLMFMRGRLAFCNVDGTRAEARAGAPSVLIAYSEADLAAIKSSGLDGRAIGLKDGGSNA
jgi:hypothetical protein